MPYIIRAWLLPEAVVQFLQYLRCIVSEVHSLYTLPSCSFVTNHPQQRPQARPGRKGEWELCINFSKYYIMHEVLPLYYIHWALAGRKPRGPPPSTGNPNDIIIHSLCFSFFLYFSTVIVSALHTRQSSSHYPPIRYEIPPISEISHRLDSVGNTRVSANSQANYHPPEGII